MGAGVPDERRPYAIGARTGTAGDDRQRRGADPAGRCLAGCGGCANPSPDPDAHPDAIAIAVARIAVFEYHPGSDDHAGSDRHAVADDHARSGVTVTDAVSRDSISGHHAKFAASSTVPGANPLGANPRDFLECIPYTAAGDNNDARRAESATYALTDDHPVADERAHPLIRLRFAAPRQLA